MQPLYPGCPLNIQPTKLAEMTSTSLKEGLQLRNLFKFFFTEEELTSCSRTGKVCGANEKSKDTPLPKLDETRQFHIYGKCSRRCRASDLITILILSIFLQNFSYADKNWDYKTLKKTHGSPSFEITPIEPWKKLSRTYSATNEPNWRRSLTLLAKNMRPSSDVVPVLTTKRTL